MQGVALANSSSCSRSYDNVLLHAAHDGHPQLQRADLRWSISIHSEKLLSKPKAVTHVEKCLDGMLENVQHDWATQMSALGLFHACMCR